MKLTKFYLFFFTILLSHTPARAELGDYNAWETINNLINPPSADNPVTEDEANAELYPLRANPDDFDDSWSPGNYLAWQTIQLSPETGALCGNGSPYKFFVNRVANTSNTIFYLEGGGACWDYESCSGAAGVRGARNPNGIPDDYMSLLNPAASLATPFVFRLHPYTNTKVQNWNMVYIPYCTGDIYFGDNIALYEDPSGEEEDLLWHHNGLKNVRAVMAWIKNNLQSPGQMLVTGCSAGGTGSLTNYAGIKQSIDAQKSYLLNDSGPIYDAPVDGSDSDYPSKRLHEQIRQSWTLDKDLGPLAFLEYLLPGFTTDNIGSINGSLSTAFPEDRLGHTHFWQDGIYSDYSYSRFYEDIYDEEDEELSEQRMRERWYLDTNSHIELLSQYDNYGYYFPHFRNVNDSHCANIVDFNHGDIQEQGLEMADFIDSIMEEEGTVLEASETDTESDYNKPFNLIYWLVDSGAI